MSITVTVSQVNRRLALMAKSDVALQDIYIRGEISNFVYHYKTGHFFFSIKDEACSIRAVMFRSFAEKQSFMPEDGMKVIVHGSVQVYEKEGTCQVYASEILRDGEEKGDIYKTFHQLKERLEKEGVFSRKRALPRFPERICVITSETGAALQDILNILGRRDPLVKVKLIPALVQGEGAAASLVSAMEKAQKTGADLIIIGRGGGSFEDLNCFNDEKLAYAIYSSDIPTISAVGHETDFTIADFAADMRAPTPSAAAELAVPDISELKSALVSLKKNLYHKLIDRFNQAERKLEETERRLRLFSPEEKIKQSSKRIDELSSRILVGYRSAVARKEQLLEKQERLIEAVNPLNVLLRGYAIVYHNNRPVTEPYSLNPGDLINVRMGNGSFAATVNEIEKEKTIQ